MGKLNAIRRKLLYVDDDEMSLESIQRLLVDKYEIHIAKTPDKAIELARKHEYEAFLMDIGLGLGTNGMELTKRIRRIKKHKKKPFIALTAYASLRDKRHFLKNGLDYFIAKPFFKNDILDLLDRVFSERAVESVRD